MNEKKWGTQKPNSPRGGARCLSALLAAALIIAWSTVCFSQDEGVEVRVADTTVCMVHGLPTRGSAQARAAAASANLERALHLPDGQLVQVKFAGAADPAADSARIYVGEMFIVELHALDAILNERADFRAYVNETAAKIRELFKQERRRSKIAAKVMAVSTVVFLGLMALLLLRTSRNWSRAARRYVQQRSNVMQPLRVATVELLPAAALREVSRAGLQIGSWIVQFVIVYAWGVTSLSLFDRTREIAERATGKLLAPALELIERLAGHVPVIFALGFALLIVALVIRFISAYFTGIERGEVETDLVRPDTARISGHLLSICVAIAALLFVAPLLTGTDNGVFTRIGEMGLGILALSTSPMLASCALGVRLVYTYHLCRGDRVSYGGHVGLVDAIGLFDLVLITQQGTIVRVPHLFSLWHATQIWQSSLEPSAPSSHENGLHENASDAPDEAGPL